MTGWKGSFKPDGEYGIGPDEGIGVFQTKNMIDKNWLDTCVLVALSCLSNL